MRPQLLGNPKDGLYYLENKDLPRVQIHSNKDLHSVNTVDKIKLWHLRMSHLHAHLLKFVKNIGCDTAQKLDGICQICPQVKQTIKLNMLLS